MAITPSTRHLKSYLEHKCTVVLFQLSDDDDDDMNSTDIDNMSESDYQMSGYRRRPNGFADHQMPNDWHLGLNNYTAPVETSGTHDMTM